MPNCYQATQTYWTVCWWLGFIPYPCQKQRSVTVCRYYFSWLCRQYVFFFVAKYTGCEPSREGTKYVWYAWSTAPGGVIEPAEVIATPPLTPSGVCSPESVQC